MQRDLGNPTLPTMPSLLPKTELVARLLGYRVERWEPYTSYWVARTPEGYIIADSPNDYKFELNHWSIKDHIIRAYGINTEQ